MPFSTKPVLPPINTPPPLDIPVLANAPDNLNTIRPSRPAHNNVLARLQALFPSPHPQPNPPPPSEPSPLPPPLPAKPLPKFIKVRILTWNMHDSLPKGDVEDLLGSVPTSNPELPRPPDEPHSLPIFSASPEHPYHIVVVAGQECPSASGIPMALGAGFKLNNKDNNSRSRHSLLPDPDESIHRKSAEADLMSPTLDKTHDHHHPPSSWSSILENWYCHPPAVGPPTATASDPNLKTHHEIQRIGPYELLIKERMMGLYLAIFIHREARPFVRGTSKSAVTAGLIGGRVGNKGGVGVSVNLDGTTLLFINAHLAAHEGKVHHRLADLAKIKAELSVDDYLSSDDPRIMAEDITDRFDTTFIFGDLNFRLDITRLHADWLISRKEYEQALEFDQLRKVMACSDSFSGFNEAPIRFPPTFKYDVLRTLKRSRTKSLRRGISATPTIITTHEKLLSEVAEKEQEHAVDDDRDEDDLEPDGASVVSSAWTSVRSRRTVDPDPDDDDPDDEGEPNSAGLYIQSPPSSASTANLMHKMWSAAAAHKAKQKWTALFREANSPKSPSPKFKPVSTPATGINTKANGEKKKWRQSWVSNKSLKSPKSPGPGTPRRASQPVVEQFPPETPGAIDPEDPRQTKAGRARDFQAALLDAVNAKPHKHIALSENNVDLEEEDKGVYDSSHKQRVPSWCDRILWKSTIIQEPDSDTEDAESTRFMPLRAKMGQIFHALRPSSLRSRRDSTWSLNHPDLSHTPTSNDQASHPHSIAHALAEKRHPLASPSSPTRNKVHPLRRLSQTRSVDSFRRSSSSEERALARTLSLEPSLAPPSIARTGAGAGRGVPLRHANTISPVMPVGDASSASTTLVSSPAQPSSPLDLDIASPANTSPSPSAPMFRWLLPFFYRDGANQHQQQRAEELGTATPKPEPPPPRRGDVVCLNYDTLDDRGMRRLEGRSDHRPVIGSYAVYI